MKAHLIDTHLLVPRSRSSAKVKVKYQGNVFQKMGVSGALVFHKHILFLSYFPFVYAQKPGTPVEMDKDQVRSPVKVKVKHKPRVKKQAEAHESEEESEMESEGNFRLVG